VIAPRKLLTSEQRERKAAYERARSRKPRKLTPEQKARKAALERARQRKPRTPEQKARYAVHQKAYRETHTNEHKACGKAYYEAHKDELRSRQSAYYEANKPACQARARVYHHAHKDAAAAGSRARRNRRRAVLHGCELASDVSTETYTRIMADDPACTYCPAAATTVDHVYPFKQRGPESDDNLVPACAACNSSKEGRLLTEWRHDRVVYGVAHSSKVAVEEARLMVAA
jgi:5-methylcytosine-specific restriction endonuclease McrA